MLLGMLEFYIYPHRMEIILLDGINPQTTALPSKYKTLFGEIRVVFAKSL